MSRSQDGLWAVEIGGELGVVAAGVMVCSQGRLFGGSERYYYVGRYDVSGGRFEAEVSVTHYNDVAGSLFGHADGLRFRMSGIASEPEMDLEGSLPTRSDTEYMVRLRKLRELD
jgi:hypothetical protein